MGKIGIFILAIWGVSLLLMYLGVITIFVPLLFTALFYVGRVIGRRRSSKEK